MTLLLIAVGLLGLCVGSFLNVVAYRVPRGTSIAFPPSYCPSCATPIKARHNVPVIGWLVLRGRCASCAAPISARYPLVEAATALLMSGVAAGLGLSPELPMGELLVVTLLAAALVHHERRRMKDERRSTWQRAPL